jgi:hypothetical protein
MTDAADQPTIVDILADYIDTEDPFYGDMINALQQRDNVMQSDANVRGYDQGLKVSLKLFKEELDKLKIR